MILPEHERHICLIALTYTHKTILINTKKQNTYTSTTRQGEKEERDTEGKGGRSGGGGGGGGAGGVERCGW